MNYGILHTALRYLIELAGFCNWFAFIGKHEKSRMAISEVPRTLTRPAASVGNGRLARSNRPAASAEAVHVLPSLTDTCRA